MGKYDSYQINPDPTLFAVALMNQKIANELAEANRLKRIELNHELFRRQPIEDQA